MSPKISWRLGLLAVILLAAPSLVGAQAQEPPPAKKAGKTAAPAAKKPIPDPKEILRQSCDFLKKQPQFSFQAEINNDRVYYGGRKLQFSQEVKASLQRPDKLRLDGDGDLESKLLIFNGKTLTLYDKFKNHYAALEVTGDIDAALDQAHQDHGLKVGLAELASAKFCNLALKNVNHALYVGLHRVRGVWCHHLAFDKKETHYQVWIEAGKQPVVRKMVVTQKNMPRSPQWTAFLSDWNFSPQFTDQLFTFTPPAGALKIKFLPVKKEAAPPSPKVKPKQKGGKS